MQKVRIFAVLLSMWLACLIHFSAVANYIPPVAKSRCLVLARNCELTEQDGRWKIKLRNAEKLFDAPIDLFWLAHRIDSDSICGGQHQAHMKEYLTKLQESVSGKELLVELVQIDSPRWQEYANQWFASGIWLFEPEKAYERAKRYGSLLLGLSPSRIKKIKNADEYKRLIQLESDKGWSKLTGTSAVPNKKSERAGLTIVFYEFRYHRKLKLSDDGKLTLDMRGFKPKLARVSQVDVTEIFALANNPELLMGEQDYRSRNAFLRAGHTSPLDITLIDKTGKTLKRVRLDDLTVPRDLLPPIPAVVRKLQTKYYELRVRVCPQSKNVVDGID